MIDIIPTFVSTLKLLTPFFNVIIIIPHHLLFGCWQGYQSLRGSWNTTIAAASASSRWETREVVRSSFVPQAGRWHYAARRRVFDLGWRKGGNLVFIISIDSDDYWCSMPHDCEHHQHTCSFSLGLHPALLAALRPSATEPMSKTKTFKFLLWDEKSIRQNKKRNKGSNIQQLERMILIQSEERPLMYKKRRHYSGTSHGDCIGPVLAPDWNET